MYQKCDSAVLRIKEDVYQKKIAKKFLYQLGLPFRESSTSLGVPALAELLVVIEYSLRLYFRPVTQPLWVSGVSGHPKIQLGF